MSLARILDVADGSIPVAAMKAAAAALAGGGLVAHPTETLYGLAVDPWNEAALGRLAAVKGRKGSQGFILIAAGPEALLKLTRDPASAVLTELARAFWPGPLTLVLPPSSHAPRGAVGAGGGIAVRVTPDPVAQALILSFGRPVTSTSVNRAGEAPATTAGEVRSRLGGDVDLILDGGPRPGGVPSTLVDLTGERPVLLREGAVERARIEEIAGRVIQ